jgi:hypothetical protein
MIRDELKLASKQSLGGISTDHTMTRLLYRSVPIFQTPWELRGAVDLRWNERSLRAVPVYRRSVFCTSSEISTLAFGAQSAAAYGHAVFADIPTGRTRHIGSARACAEARKVFRPGPVLATAGAVSRDRRIPPRRQ